MTKQLLFACALITQLAMGAQPKPEVVASCLAGRPTSEGVSVSELPTNEVLTDESYRPGYAAIYLLALSGGDVGLARGKRGDALIEAGKLYPLRDAKLLTKAHDAVSFEPELASWLTVEEMSLRYLCVSFNFPGLGQSGTFQRVRGGYLLPLQPRHERRQLYYAVSEISGAAGSE